MKKTLLAAALTVGFFGVAQAETSVTLYGILDGGIGYQHTSGTLKGADAGSTKTGMINGIQSGDRWGLKGTEDLGDGLHVVFQLESGFDLGTGKSAQGGRLFGRQATLGLQGDSWGRLDIGRQTNIASKYIGAFDPFGASFSRANAGTTFGSANTYRVDNMVMYQTPNFSGFQFGVGYSFNTDGSINAGDEDTSQNDNNAREITTGLQYVNGPIAVAATYDRLMLGQGINSTSTTTANTTTGAITTTTTPGDKINVSEWTLGGSYDFEVVKAYLAFSQNRNGVFAGGDTTVDGGTIFGTQGALDGFRANSYLVGLSAPLGAGNLMFSWQMSDANRTDDSVKDANGITSKQNIFGLGYTYNLSKRTNLYVWGDYTKHALYQDDLKTSEVGVGLRHQF